MPGLLPDIDPDGLLEYSVVYTDRSVNHMSVSFQTVMNDISRVLGDVYNADAVVVVPGSGTYGMEAVARQFATGEHVLVVRNGWFSYRWTQIFEAGNIPASHTVIKARRAELVEDYTQRLANPYLAAERGYVDDVIEPSQTRRKLIAGMRLLESKREEIPERKHGNVPL